MQAYRRIIHNSIASEEDRILYELPENPALCRAQHCHGRARYSMVKLLRRLVVKCITFVPG